MYHGSIIEHLKLKVDIWTSGRFYRYHASQ